MHYDIPEIESSECPAAAISHESRELISLDSRNRRLKDAAGATLYGMDARRWPAWWADVVTTIETQRVMEHNARVEAEIAEARSRNPR